ncbi:MAG: GNAT family N-acetyltransferase [Ruminiclostridium sp.]|nr:GNAT family N-acetyltransferase [Ruminiclostridium sp.]
MDIVIREFEPKDLRDMIGIWNKVVDDGNAFPQSTKLNGHTAAHFFNSQTFTGVAEDVRNGDIVGLYILHPNNVGRCSHICNASFAVDETARGYGIGRMLVEHSLEKGRERGFRIMQFNAVTASNTAAQGLYESLGFVRLGEIPAGFLRPDGSYDNIILYYKTL